MQNRDSRSLSLVDGALGAGGLSTLRIEGTRIAAVGAQPRPGDPVLDLHGDRVLPGLINAHDHLQLNGFPRLNYRGRYANVGEWILDIQARLHSDPLLMACHAVPRDDRLLQGGVKNLLSGVTTVAHHDPHYFFLMTGEFPVRTVQQYGWSHSLSLDGEAAVARSYRRTAADRPWIVHAAEGTDAAAAAEFDRLQALGCIGPNTILVHGVALDGVRQKRLAAAGAGLVWCPSSNLYLFGRTAEVDCLLEGGRLALGTDSRLSGERDLLKELQLAREVAELDETKLEALVTGAAARLLRLQDRGVLQAGALADILVLPAGMLLSKASRADIRLLAIDGQVCYGDEDYVAALNLETRMARVRVDGRTKCLRQTLVEQIVRANIVEPGLEVTFEEARPWPSAAYC